MQISVTAALAVSVVSQSLWAQVREFEASVRVRIERSVAVVTVSGFGLRIAGSAPSFLVASPLPRFQKIQVRRRGEKWLVLPLGVTRAAPAVAAEEFSERELKLSGDLIKVEGRPVSNDLVFLAAGDGETSGSSRFDVVSRVAMHDYLKGVLPSEMPAQWPREALKAQAVAARSYVMSLLMERKDDRYDVDDTVSHQVFRPLNFLKATAAEQKKILNALDSTKGLYLRDTQGMPYRAYFHADCGGRTEEPKKIWGAGTGSRTEENYGTVADGRCALNPRSAWQVVVTRTELKQAFEQEILAIQVVSRSASGRVEEVRLSFAGGERRLSAQEFRRRLGFDRVKSTNFDLSFYGDSLELKGRGHGHGAGMCQKGARFMALAGASFQEIVKRYYPHAHSRLRPPVSK